MKKIILFVFTSFFIVPFVKANTIYENNVNKVSGACSNGDAFSGLRDSDGFWTVSGPGGTYFSKSQSEVIHKACYVKKSIKSSFINVKKEALVYLKQNGEKGIIGGLSSEIAYSSVKAMARLKRNDNYFITSSGGRLKLLKTFKNKDLIDTYYKATDGKRTVYVRKSETK